MAANEPLRDAQRSQATILAAARDEFAEPGLGGARRGRSANHAERNEREHGTVHQSRGAEIPLTGVMDACARPAIRAICPWRDQVAAVGLDTISKLLKTCGMEL